MYQTYLFHYDLKKKYFKSKLYYEKIVNVNENSLNY